MVHFRLTASNHEDYIQYVERFIWEDTIFKTYFNENTDKFMDAYLQMTCDWAENSEEYHPSDSSMDEDDSDEKVQAFEEYMSYYGNDFTVFRLKTEGVYETIKNEGLPVLAFENQYYLFIQGGIGLTQAQPLLMSYYRFTQNRN
jgi:hypothetical protein